MNIAILEFNNHGIDQVKLELNPKIVLTSSINDPDKKLADLSLQLDEYSIIGVNPIDVVYVNKDNDFDATKFIPPIDNEVCFISDRITGSFFCKPNILSLISNLYKIDFSKKFSPMQFNIHYANNTTSLIHVKKMMYIIDRLGMNVHVI